MRNIQFDQDPKYNMGEDRQSVMTTLAAIIEQSSGTNPYEVTENTVISGQASRAVINAIYNDSSIELPIQQREASWIRHVKLRNVLDYVLEKKEDMEELMNTVESAYEDIYGPARTAA